jgi:hypothetical protein
MIYILTILLALAFIPVFWIGVSMVCRRKKSVPVAEYRSVGRSALLVAKPIRYGSKWFNT